MGCQHIEIFSELGFRNLVVYDENKETVIKVKKRFPHVKKLEKLNLSNQEFDGVIISTPPNTHQKIVRLCLKNNLPFLLEKPLGESSKGWKEIIRDLKKKEIPSFIGYPRRFGEGYLKLKKICDSGNIGKIIFIHSTFSQDFSRYRPDYKNTYYVNHKTGGGIIFDALSHHMDYFVFLFGPIKKITSLKEKNIILDTQVEDFAILDISFRNNDVEGLIIGNQFQKPNTDLIEIIGTKGSLKYDRIKNILYKSLNDEWKEEKINGDWKEILKKQALSFIDLINKKKTIGTSLAEGLNIVESIESRKSL